MKCNIYRFNIKYCGFENEIWRTIDITDSSTVAKLAYTIMAIFNTNANHLYEIEYNGICYSFNPEEPSENKPEETRLRKLMLDINSKLHMTYDYGNEQRFSIELIDIREMEKGTGTKYPNVVDGAGYGIIDDMPSDILLENLKKHTDSSPITYFDIDGNICEYYINNFSLEECNRKLKSLLPLITFSYSNPDY